MRKNHNKIVCIKLVHLPYLTLVHYISFTQEQLCTGLATDRVYVH